MKIYEKDSSASAVVLGDYGLTWFNYSDKDGFYLTFERHVRIKIFTKDGLDFGNFEIPFYHFTTDRESVFDIKGVTYNIEEGKIIEDKLGKESIYEDALTDNWDVMKISMPSVKEGSLIELTYKIKSPFLFNLQEWYFQSKIPTVRSEYTTVIPQYFNYQKLTYGYHPINSEPVSSTTNAFDLVIKQRDEFGRMVEVSNQNYRYTSFVEQFISVDVPAFIEEPYLTTSKDYLSRITFELMTIKYPWAATQEYRGTWNSLNKSFLDHDRFGVVMNKTFFAKSELESITAGKSEEQKVAAVLTYIKRNMEWDRTFQKYSTAAGLKPVFDDHKGSSADINLMLTGFLNEIGIEANPVLVSTRDHGRPRTDFAISDQFNYVICAARINDKTILLDATDKNLPPGFLPLRCLNQQGWKVSNSNPGWISLKANLGVDNLINLTVSLNEDGVFEGILNQTQRGYDAFYTRGEILVNGKEKFIEDFQKEKEGWTINSYEFENLENSNMELKHTVNFNFEGPDAADNLYLKSLFDFGLDENPFRLRDRQYPVDFGYPIKETIMVNLIIPEDYVVEEMPKSMGIMTPDKSAIFRFNVSQIGNKLQVVSMFEIRETTFVPSEYPQLREFFNLVVSKQAEQVVLKRKQ